MSTTQQDPTATPASPDVNPLDIVSVCIHWHDNAIDPQRNNITVCSCGATLDHLDNAEEHLAAIILTALAKEGFGNVAQAKNEALEQLATQFETLASQGTPFIPGSVTKTWRNAAQAARANKTPGAAPNPALRTLSAAADLDALPEGALVLAPSRNPRHPKVFRKVGAKAWIELEPSDRDDGEISVSSEALLRWSSHDGTATVLWEPHP